MASRLTLLVTSAGRRNQLLDCFRQDGAALGLAVRVLAADASPELSPACQQADASFAVPRCTDAGYVPALLAICEREGVHLLVPTIDPELLVLSRASEAFLAIGVRVVVSTVEVVALARDKLATIERLANAGITTPRTLRLADYRRDPGQLPGPVIAKPIGGSASMGIVRPQQPADLADLDGMNYIVQELWQGREYTVNTFFDAGGRLRAAVPHLRIKVRDGEVEKGQTERVPVLEEVARKLESAFAGARGPLCFQAIVTSAGDYAVFEVNARFGGGYPLTHAAGAHFTRWLLEEHLRGSGAANDQWREGVLMLRYDTAIYAHAPANPLKQLVIVGAGGFGREIYSWAKQATSHGRDWVLKGFIDDNSSALAGTGVTLPIIGSYKHYVPVEGDVFVCAFGQPHLRRECHESITRRGGKFTTLVHPSVIFGDGVVLGEGVVVCPYAVVSANATIGEGSAIYYHSSVDHDAVIGRWCQISAHCDITGSAILGDEVFLGSHASILPGITVANGAIVGAGAVVSRAVAAAQTVAGVPARPLS